MQETHVATLAAIRRDIESLRNRLAEAEAAERYLVRMSGQPLATMVPSDVARPVDPATQESLQAKSWHEAAEFALRSIGQPASTSDILRKLDNMGYMQGKRKGMSRNIARNGLFTAMTRKQDVFERTKTGYWTLVDWKNRESRE